MLITTSGGFYRYRLYDIVTCIRYENDLPILQFEGKSNVVSDLTGEKLNEIHVSYVIKEALMKLNIESELYHISPQKTDHDCIYKYCLYLHTTSSFETSILKQEIEMGLQQNFHYKHSRALNQLQPLDIALLTSKDVRKYYDKELTKKKLGTTKFGILRNDFNE